MVTAPAADFPAFNLSGLEKDWTTFAVSQARADKSALVLLRAKKYEDKELAQLTLKDDNGNAVPYATVEIRLAVGKKSVGIERLTAETESVYRCTADAKGHVKFPATAGEYTVSYSGQESTVKLSKSGGAATVQLKNVVSVTLIVSGADADTQIRATLNEGSKVI